jgi:hypothetical protein
MRRILNLHPPWVHPAIWIVWMISGTAGPILIVAALLTGPGDRWWLAGAVCLV